jgi:hypothetical protein
MVPARPQGLMLYSRFIRVPRARAGPILPPVGDEEFADYIASRLAGLPDVLAVSLGGSRASGTSRPDSDWDFAVYYRGRFDPDDLRGLGWPGEVSAIGGWGGGVFNGGAWLRVEGRPVGHVADTAGLIATAAAQAAHAVLAGRGEWVTNEKALLDRAGLRSVDAVLSGLAADPEQLTMAVDAAERLLGLSSTVPQLSPRSASATLAPPLPGSYCMDAAFMSLELPGWGIHVVSTGGLGPQAKVSAVTEARRDTRAPEDPKPAAVAARDPYRAVTPSVGAGSGRCRDDDHRRSGGLRCRSGSWPFV